MYLTLVKYSSSSMSQINIIAEGNVTETIKKKFPSQAKMYFKVYSIYCCV